MIKICQECGSEFETSNGMQKFCNGPHYRECQVCGSFFEVTRYHLTAKDAKVTCSKKCSVELRKQTNMKRYGGVAPASSTEVRTKMKATNLDRYGVKHAAQSIEIQKKMQATNKERYGASFYTQSDEGRRSVSDSWKQEDVRFSRLQHISETNLIKYGSKSSLGNSDVREKARKTYFEKTGYSEPFANPDVQLKIEDTNMIRYGARRPIQSGMIRQKIQETNLEKYGFSNPIQNVDIKNKVRSTCLERYGNTCFLQSDLGKKLSKEKMMQNHGCEWYSQSYDWKISRMLDPTKIGNLMEFENDPKSYILSKYVDKPTIRILSFDLGIHENTVGQILIQSECQNLVSYVYSYMESEMYDSIKDIDPSIRIERNVHDVIAPLELDIYLPDYKIAIECNPTATHNSSVCDPWGGPPKPYDYHFNKTTKCEENGVFLFHVFGSEWTYSKEIILSMIRNLLGKNKSKIYARNCNIQEVSAKDCKEFLNENHRQGNTNSSVRLGLYLKNELVSIMTFGKMRSTIGTDKTDLSDCWELVRFCSKLNTTVVGGADKLFKYFIRNYAPSRIRSFSDRAHTRGGLYEKLRFTKVRESTPGYVWVDGRTDISYHRYNAQKQNICRFLHDDSIDLSKTEKQIMEEHGFLSVYDCGTILWEYVSE